MCNAMFLRLCAASLILWLGTVKGAKPVVRSMSIDAKGKIKANQKAKSVIRKVHGTKDSNAKVDVALTRDTSSCYVTVYEHWPENIAAGISGLEAAESAWGGHFPTGASMVLHGVGDHPLGALSNLTSSVKVEGPCCKAYGYATSSCADSSQGSPIETTTQLIEGLPAGVVTPATGLASLWSCNDCTQCVKVVQECPTEAPTPAPTTQAPTPAPTALPNCPIACSGYSGGANASQVRVCLEVNANSAGVITGGRGVCVLQDTAQLPSQCTTVNILGASSTGQVRLCNQITEAAPAACPASCASLHAGADATSPVCYSDSSKACYFKYPYTTGVTPTSHFCTKYDYYDRVCMPVTPPPTPAPFTWIKRSNPPDLGGTCWSSALSAGNPHCQFPKPGYLGGNSEAILNLTACKSRCEDFGTGCIGLNWYEPWQSCNLYGTEAVLKTACTGICATGCYETNGISDMDGNYNANGLDANPLYPNGSATGMEGGGRRRRNGELCLQKVTTR